ncbi:MAG: hypothetical protein ACRDFQ_07310 [Anaerolineales bacterium]
MSNARKLLIVLVMLGALVVVGAIAYRVGYQHGVFQADGLARIMENFPERLRAFRYGQPFGRLPLRMRPGLPTLFGIPRMLPWLMVGAVLIGAVVIAFYAVLAPKPAAANRQAAGKRTRKA